jgi:shikimate kinase
MRMGEDRIFLVGFMGVGKTTVGKLLAARLSRPFIDLDDEIQRREALSINAIFQKHGEGYFRRVETRILRELAAGEPRVVATGGGTFASEANIRCIQDHGVAVWLHCQFEQILKRCEASAERPLFRDRESIEALLASRRPFYCRARLQVDSGGSTPDRIVDQIIALLAEI